MKQVASECFSVIAYFRSVVAFIAFSVVRFLQQVKNLALLLNGNGFAEERAGWKGQKKDPPR
jgi:hypothetical protein